MCDALQRVEERVSESQRHKAATKEMPSNFIGPLTRDRTECEACTAMRLKCSNKLGLTCEHGKTQAVEDIPVDFIQRHRLSVSELRQIPHFADYDPGDPTHAIYIKNLANSVDEIDLKRLFNRFQASNYTLLKGRMRGQAFVTFYGKTFYNTMTSILFWLCHLMTISFLDKFLASEALNLVNGFNLKGKPMVIQFKKLKKL